ncbi:TetR/AcrR family transcriptional regulator [Fodinicola acaciae]|uniref:TetR/AcrR family transcriptional regulator n=1 Tax=Fodinicola acaciae TaxID=2681555 RepID=UPI0013D81E4D|nr:TetR/AcrR family transcriptional regulator [Fodinicola acaciae]
MASDVSRRPGRPRSQQADAAILAAALDLLVESGAGQTSIEQVARRAGVTRATVYRRFAGKTELLIEAIEAGNDPDRPAPDWPDLPAMIADWSGYLSQPRNRRMLRRLYGAVDDFPELLETYRNLFGGARSEAVFAVLRKEIAAGRLPADSDVGVILALLNGAILHHLGGYGDDCDARDLEKYLLAAVRQLGLRS